MSTEALAANEPVTTPAETPAVEAPSEPSDDVKSDEPVNEGDKPEVKTEEKPELSELDKYKYATQKRIDRLAAQAQEAKKQAQEASERLKQYEQAKQETGPKESDFETTEEYLKALGAWEAKQEIAKAEHIRKQEETQKAFAERMQKRSAEVSAQEAEFRKVTPDYDDATQVLNEYVETADKSSQGFTVFRDVLMDMKDLPAVTYHLGKNPDVIESMMKMGPIDIARTLFRIEFDLENKTKQAIQPNPTPPSPVSGQQKTSKSLEQMDYKDIKKAWKL